MVNRLLEFKARELTPEIMDDFSLDMESHIEALQGLERINRISLTAVPIWKEIKKHFSSHPKKSLRILDVACGGGDLIMELTLKARKENLPFVFEGCDFNPRTVEYAQHRAQKKNLPADYFILDALQNHIPERFDVVISSLFLHHLETDHLICFLKKLAHSQARLIILSDLKRSRFGWLLAHLAGRILSHSPIVHIDGPRSVKAAFTANEILGLAQDAGLSNAKVRSIWPLRYLLTSIRP